MAAHLPCACCSLNKLHHRHGWGRVGCLRMQLDTTNKDFRALAPERAYADFILAHIALIFIAWNYIG